MNSKTMNKESPLKDSNGRISKSAANYRYADDPKQCCSNCDMIRGKGFDATCTAVRGIIHRAYTCDLWEAKKS